jgi:Nucleotidyltransferase domain
MVATETDLVLKRFVSEIRVAVPTVAVWAHGSLALGDFQPGRSDLDLIAIVEVPLDGEGRDRLAGVHRRLLAEEPAAARLHCSYMVRAALTEAETDHVTWAHDMILERPVTPVTRRELHEGGLTLHGPAPAELLPPLAPGQLEDFIRRDLAEYWLPVTGKRVRWIYDIWVDLGLLVLARATVTLRDGRLITKGEALAELLAMGAPADVVRDIHDRRYAHPEPISRWRRVRRAMRARAFVRRGIQRTLATARPPEQPPAGTPAARDGVRPGANSRLPGTPFPYVQARLRGGRRGQSEEEGGGRRRQVPPHERRDHEAAQARAHQRAGEAFQPGQFPFPLCRTARRRPCARVATVRPRSERTGGVPQGTHPHRGPGPRPRRP